MSDVFISYAREDQALVSRLHDALKRRGRSTWVDWEGIPPTAEWLGEVYDAIDSSEAFLFIISPDSVASSVCLKELQHAVDQNKRLIPLVFQEPDSAKVPPSLGKLNWIFIREADDFEGAIDTLVEMLDTDLARVKAHTRLLVRARDWDSRKHHSLLLRSRELEEAERQFAAASDLEPKPTPLQLRFITTSRRRAATVQRRILASVTLALVVAITLAVVAWVQRQYSERREVAAVVRTLAEAKPLDALARAVAEMDRWFADDVPEVRSSLLAALQTPKERAVYTREGGHEVASVAVMRDAAIAAALDPNLAPQEASTSVAIWAGDGTRRADWPVGARVAALASCAADSLLLAISGNKSLRVRDLESGSETSIIRLPVDESTEELADRASTVNDMVPVTQNAYATPPPSETTRRPTSAPGCRPGSGDPVVAAFSYDCKRIVIGRGCATQIWSHEGEPKMIATLREPSAPLAIAVDRSGHAVARGYEDGSIHKATARDGKTFEDARYASHPPARRRSLGRRLPLRRSVKALAMSPTGSHVASADGSTLRLWQDKDGAARPVGDGFHGHDQEITALAFDPGGGAFVASGGKDNTIRVWDLEGGSLGEPRRGHDSWIRSVAVADDGRSVFSGSNDGTVRRWEVTRNPVPVPCGERIKVRGLAADGQTVLLEAGGGLFGVNANCEKQKILRGEPTREAHSLPEPGPGSAAETRPSAMSASGRYVAYHDRHGEIVIHDLEGEKEDWPIADPPSGLRTLAIARDGDAVAGARDAVADAGDVSIQLWSRGRSEPHSLTGGHSRTVISLAFTPDGRMLASGSQDNTIRLWDVDTRENVGLPFRGHEGWVSALAISPDGRWVASGSWDRTVRLWDMDGNPMGTPLRGHAAWITHVGFDAERSKIVSLDNHGRAGVWQGGDASDWLSSSCRQLSGHASRNDRIFTQALSVCAKAFPDRRPDSYPREMSPSTSLPWAECSCAPPAR